MKSTVRIIYFCELNKGFSLKLQEDYGVQQHILEEGQKVQLANMEYNNQACWSE